MPPSGDNVIETRVATLLPPKRLRSVHVFKLYEEESVYYWTCNGNVIVSCFTMHYYHSAEKCNKENKQTKNTQKTLPPSVEIYLTENVPNLSFNHFISINSYNRTHKVWGDCWNLSNRSWQFILIHTTLR